jgi:hypothetical protein
MLLRIVYVSTLGQHVSEADLAVLVEKAAVFNRSRNITGILAIQDGRVCQILEGPDQAVDALFASIGRDGRHSGIVELVRHEIDALSFDDWGMVRRGMVDIVVAAYTT